MIIHKKVKVCYIACVALVCAGFLFSDCTRKFPTDPKTINKTNNADITASIKMPNKQLASLLTSISLTVTTPGSAVALVDTSIALDGTKAQATIQVPAKKQLIFTASAFTASADDTTLVLQGQETLTATSGQQVTLPIIMQYMVPAIILTPTEKTVTAGDSITVYLNARNVKDMTTLGVRVTFDPTRLAVAESNLERAFMEGNQGTMQQLFFQEGSTPGTFDTIVSVFPAIKAVSDSGRIAKIIFRTITTGTTDIGVVLDNATNPDLGLYDKNAELAQVAIGLGSRVIIQ